MGPQNPAGIPQGDDGGDVFVTANAKGEGHVSTGVLPGRPHSAQEPS